MCDSRADNGLVKLLTPFLCVCLPAYCRRLRGGHEHRRKRPDDVALFVLVKTLVTSFNSKAALYKWFIKVTLVFRNSGKEHLQTHRCFIVLFWEVDALVQNVINHRWNQLLGMDTAFKSAMHRRVLTAGINLTCFILRGAFLTIRNC